MTLTGLIRPLKNKSKTAIGDVFGDSDLNFYTNHAADRNAGKAILDAADIGGYPVDRNDERATGRSRERGTAKGESKMMNETTTRPRTKTLSADIRALMRRVEELEAENQRLRDELREHEERAREWDADEQEYTQDIIKLENQLVLAKSLINIPDNIAGLVEEVIKTRLLAWEGARENPGWWKSVGLRFRNEELDQAFSSEVEKE